MAGGVGVTRNSGLARSARADWGMKALLVCALALSMAIPLAFVLLLVAEREHRAAGVTQEVSALQGGSQQLLGPMLIAPYTIPAPPKQPGDNGPQAGPRTGWYVVSPEQGSAKVAVKGSSLHRSIFDVPVYEADTTIQAHFAPLPKTVNLPDGAKVDWTRALIVVGLSDLRGAKSDVTGAFSSGAARSSLTFAPASGISLGAPTPPAAADGPPPPRPMLNTQTGASGGDYGLVAAPAGDVSAGGDLSIALRFTGAQRLSVLPFAKSTTVHAAGDWPAPSFDGGFLPENRQLAARTFTADWSVPFIARGLSEAGDASDLSLSTLGAKDLGVSFVPASNPYKNVERALKYAVMFVGLVFLTFFVFESLSGKRLHAAQYVLIGLAQMVFYLLLLSLAEYIGFDLAFAGAAVATVALIGSYAGAAFRNRRTGALALGIFAVVYGLIYLLMRLEDFALLAGSLASFVGLAVAMFLTRHIDWYGGKDEAGPEAAKIEPGEASAPAN